MDENVQRKGAATAMETPTGNADQSDPTKVN